MVCSLVSTTFDSPQLDKQYTVLEFQFRSVKCTVVTRSPKNFEQLFIPIQVMQGRSQCADLNNHFKKFSNVFILYSYTYSNWNDKSVIILLKNSLTKIWSKVSKIRLILWMVHTSVWKGWRKLESWVEMNVLCIGDQGY